jgi:hypothetical protein
VPDTTLARSTPSTSTTIHHYKRAAQKLWSFCSGSAEQVAGVLAWMREQGEETDWWKVGEPRRRS